MPVRRVLGPVDPDGVQERVTTVEGIPATPEHSYHSNMDLR